MAATVMAGSAPNQMSVANHDNDKKLKIISVMHMVVAVLIFIVGVVQLTAIDHWPSYIAFGIWGGIWIFVSGFVGYLGSKDEGRGNSYTCYMSTHMSFAIISSVLVGIFLIIFGFATSQLSCEYYRYGRYSHPSSASECRAARGLGAFFMVLMFIELILSFLSSILCCTALCCGRQSPGQVILVPAGGNMIQTSTTVGQTGQMVYIQQGQVPMVPPGAVAPPPTMHVMQQGPQYYPQPQVALPPQTQDWPAAQNAPPPYSGPMATGYDPNISVGPVPQKN